MLSSEQAQPGPSGNADDELRRQRLELVFQTAHQNQALSPLVGVVVVSAMWPVADHRFLFGWLVVLTLSSICRHCLARKRIKVPHDPEVARRWEREFFVSLALVGSVWGLGGWLLMPATNEAYQALLYCFVLGMAGGTMALYSAHGPGVAFVMVAMLGPATLYQFLQDGFFHTALGLAGVLFVLGTLRATRQMNTALLRNIELTEELDHLARHDALSGLHNRRGFTELAAPAVANASRARRDCALIMLDVDDFKVINDRLGHATGDAVIAAFGAMLADTVREGEPTGRIGGEEFAVLLPDASLRDAELLAERLLERSRSLDVTAAGEPVVVTVSIGIAALGAAPATLDTLLSRADEALYAAKRKGKDRAMVASYAAGDASPCLAMAGRP